MPLNKSQPARVRRAEAELKAKMALEVKMKKELNSLFVTIAADLSKTLARSGGTNSATEYAARTKRIIDRQYRRTSKAFTGQILRFLRKNLASSREKIIAELLAISGGKKSNLRRLLRQLADDVKVDLKSFSQVNSARSTASITKTNQKEIDRAVSKSTAVLTEKLGREPTNGELANASRIEFLRRSKSRTGTIAATETQRAAEGTKQIERDNFFSLRNGGQAQIAGLDVIKPQDTWVTQGDNLVRDNPSGFDHLSADGQIKEEGTFTVSNQLLRYPGDSSLGASAGNTINCRCSSITVIE